MIALTNFLRPVRTLLNDNDPDGIYAYEDQQLIDALKTVVDFGRVPGYEIDGESVKPSVESQPEVTPANPDAFLRLCLHAVKVFVVDRTRVTFNTRAFSESIGQPTELVNLVIDDIYTLENGTQCL